MIPIDLKMTPVDLRTLAEMQHAQIGKQEDEIIRLNGQLEDAELQLEIVTYARQKVSRANRKLTRRLNNISEMTDGILS